MKSEYRTLLFVDKPHPWYSINNSGHLICHLKNSNRIGARDRLGRILGGSSCPHNTILASNTPSSGVGDVIQMGL